MKNEIYQKETEYIKSLVLGLEDGHIEIEEHKTAGWVHVAFYELKRGLNKKGELTERMYSHYFTLNKEQVKILKAFLK